MKFTLETIDTLQIALNMRMEHCREELTEIVLTGKFETSDGIESTINTVYSKELQKHFSIAAYKAMQSAKEKIKKATQKDLMNFDYFDVIELTQIIKAVGALKSEHAELTSFLVDALVWNLLKDKNQ